MRYNSALQNYNQCAEISSRYPKLKYHLSDIWNAIGLVYARLEEFDQALSFYYKGLSLDNITNEQRINIEANVEKCKNVFH